MKRIISPTYYDICYSSHHFRATVEPLYKDTLHKDNRACKDIDSGPDLYCI